MKKMPKFFEGVYTYEKSVGNYVDSSNGMQYP